MEVIYLIALEISIILGILKFFSLELGIFFSLILVLGIFIFNREKNIFLLLLPILFLIKTFFLFNSSNSIGDIKIFQISLYEGRGKIEKIDNKYPLNNSYLYLSNKSNGKYEVIGEIKEINKKYGNEYFNIQVEKITSIPQNSINKYFQKKSENILRNSGYDMKRVYEAVILGKGYRLTQ